MKAQHVSSGIPLIIRSSKLYLQPLVYIPMRWPAVVQAGQRQVTTCVYKPEAANTVWSSWWWAVCRSKHVEPSWNFRIINSITRLHLVRYFYWFILRCTDPWVLNLHNEQFLTDRLLTTHYWRHKITCYFVTSMYLPIFGAHETDMRKVFRPFAPVLPMGGFVHLSTNWSKITAFWDVTSCSHIDIYQLFRGPTISIRLPWRCYQRALLKCTGYLSDFTVS